MELNRKTVMFFNGNEYVRFIHLWHLAHRKVETENRKLIVKVESSYGNYNHCCTRKQDGAQCRVERPPRNVVNIYQRFELCKGVQSARIELPIFPSE